VRQYGRLRSIPTTILIDKWGRIDTLVCNAAVVRLTPMADAAASAGPGPAPEHKVHYGRVDVAVSQNGAATKLFHNIGATPGLRIKLQGSPGNPSGVGALMRLQFKERQGPAREIHAGSGYWSQDSLIQVLDFVQLLAQRPLEFETGAKWGYSPANYSLLGYVIENVKFKLTLANDGSVPLTGVTATVTSTTPGVVIQHDTASFPDIPVGGASESTAPHFTAYLPPSLSCGGETSFQVSIASQQGSWSGSFSLKR
jgi:hypothetical protein